MHQENIQTRRLRFTSRLIVVAFVQSFNGRQCRDEAGILSCGISLGQVSP